MPPAIDRIWNERFGCKTFSAGYGLTEASLISMLPAGETNNPGAAGKPNTVDFDVRLVDDDDVEVPAGEIGEIVCRPTGPNLMFAGYWRRPEETLGVLRNLWFHTGDLGRLDADGYLFFVGRRDDMVKVKGATVYPSEVETALLTVPGVARAHVVDLHFDDDRVEVGAVVALTADAALTDADLAREAKARLSAFKVPSHWAVVARDDIPVTATGKVDKAALQALLGAGRRDEHAKRSK
jgi:crotonobetaine/carnitine-CoA ligase